MPIMQDRANKGIVFNNGREWRRIHRFTVRTLKDLGMGRQCLTVAIQVSVQCTLYSVRVRTLYVCTLYAVQCTPYIIIIDIRYINKNLFVY